MPFPGMSADGAVRKKGWNTIGSSSGEMPVPASSILISTDVFSAIGPQLQPQRSVIGKFEGIFEDIIIAASAGPRCRPLPESVPVGRYRELTSIFLPATAD